MRSVWAFAALPLLLVAPPARADDAPTKGPDPVVAPTGPAAAMPDSVKSLEHDKARRMRADLPDRLADHDTADGRMDGDVGVVVGLGATFSGQSVRSAAEVRVRYLETAGIFATYEDGFGAASSDPVRVLATGIELRPLFLGRWVTGTELGLTWSDLVIDSFGLEVGAFFEQPPYGSFGA